jgi:mRNA interferase MazF
MKEEGQIILFEFPRGDLSEGKLRPALLINSVPGAYNLWLICMISTQLQRKVNGFDEIVAPKDDDFKTSGLKKSSLI